MELAVKNDSSSFTQKFYELAKISTSNYEIKLEENHTPTWFDISLNVLQNRSISAHHVLEIDREIAQV